MEAPTYSMHAPLLSDLHARFVEPPLPSAQVVTHKISWAPIIITVCIVICAIVFLVLFLLGRKGSKGTVPLQSAASSFQQKNQDAPVDSSTCTPFDCSLMHEQILAGLVNSKPDLSTNVNDFAVVNATNIADVNPAKPDSFVCGVNYTFQGKPKSRRMSFAPVPATCKFEKDGLSLLATGDFCDDPLCSQNATLASMQDRLAAEQRARKTGTVAI